MNNTNNTNIWVRLTLGVPIILLLAAFVLPQAYVLFWIVSSAVFALGVFSTLQVLYYLTEHDDHVDYTYTIHRYLVKVTGSIMPFTLVSIFCILSAYYLHTALMVFWIIGSGPIWLQVLYKKE